MSDVTTRQPKQLTEWLDELVLAHWRDVRMVSIRALEQGGLEMQYSRCDRHPEAGTMRLSSVARHLMDVESQWERTHPGEGPVHLPGDVRPAGPLEQLREISTPARWERSVCRSCRQPVIWAHTQRGSRMPVDAAPNPAGNLYLVPWPQDPIEPMVIGIREQQADTSGIDPAQLYMSHFATCPAADRHRRKPRR